MCFTHIHTHTESHTHTPLGNQNMSYGNENMSCSNQNMSSGNQNIEQTQTSQQMRGARTTTKTNQNQHLCKNHIKKNTTTKHNKSY